MRVSLPVADFSVVVVSSQSLRFSVASRAWFCILAAEILDAVLWSYFCVAYGDQGCHYSNPLVDFL